VAELGNGAPWRPANARLYLRQLGLGREVVDPSAALVATAGWLRRAADATSDGGVSWGYRLRGGWAASYPETTGYIVPTFLALDASPLADGRDRERAERSIRFLAGVRLPDGSFPGRRIDENRTEPSVFNTAQILHGLTAWHTATGDDAIRTMALDAARWLVDGQDEDGTWRRHAYGGIPVAYVAHGTCWLAEHAEATGDDAARRAAERHLDWVLGQYDAGAGWFDLAGFTAEDHAARRAVTHTIAYTIWGVLDLGLRLGRDDAIQAAATAAAQVAGVVRREGRLPGMLDAAYIAGASWECLTGNSQMALIWLRLASLGHSAGDREAATIALDRVRRSISLRSSDRGIRGGVAGSDPPWGTYIRFTFPNWAAKFTIDALLAEGKATGPVATVDEAG
jgi:hypothetical protein